MKIHYDADCPPALGEPVAVIGYGSQGRAHALNLRDSGEDVRVGLYPGSKSFERAAEDGVRALEVPEAVAEASVVMILTPDAGQGKLFRESIAKQLKPGTMLMFAHGFAIHFAQIKPEAEMDVSMIAPKGPGHLVRSTYVQGMGVPALIAVHQDASGRAKTRALADAPRDAVDRVERVRVRLDLAIDRHRDVARRRVADGASVALRHLRVAVDSVRVGDARVEIVIALAIADGGGAVVLAARHSDCGERTDCRRDARVTRAPLDPGGDVGVPVLHVSGDGRDHRGYPRH